MTCPELPGTPAFARTIAILGNPMDLGFSNAHVHHIRVPRSKWLSGGLLSAVLMSKLPKGLAGCKLGTMVFGGPFAVCLASLSSS